jgi:microcystin-dependent protein
MSNPYVGEIRMFGGNFAPIGWAFCNGQILPISEFETLFNLIGTTYGGDGESTFAVPDLRGRAMIHQGTGPGLSTYVIGQAAGVEQVTLTTNQIPAHTHVPLGVTSGGNSPSPQNAYWSALNSGQNYYSQTATGGVAIAANAIQPAGGNQPHENLPPILAISFIISLFGIFPSPS